MMKKILSCIAVSKFLITTGRTTSQEKVKKSEILDLSDKNKFQCADWLDYPIDLYGATGGLVDQVPVICGGWSHVDFDDCYKITAKQANFVFKMSTARYEAASVMINNTLLWITGGRDDYLHFLSSSEFIHIGCE